MTNLKPWSYLHSLVAVLWVAIALDTVIKGVPVEPVFVGCVLILLALHNALLVFVQESLIK